MALNSFADIFLPYCIKKLEDGRYVFLNREYQPLGFQEKYVAKEEDHAVDLKITPALFEKLKAKEVEKQSINYFWLYEGGCNPCVTKERWEEYQEKLKLLSKLEKPCAYTGNSEYMRHVRKKEDEAFKESLRA